MHLSTRLRALLAVTTLSLFATAARAEGLRILSSDARGVTLQVSAETWTLSAPGPDGRVKILGVPTAHSLAIPGRGLLPAWSAMLAIPPDAHPSARVLSSGVPVTREGLKLAIAGRPAFRPDPDGGEPTPVMEDVPPDQDGAWPLELVHLGTPSSFRGRRLLGIEVRPFRYDDSAGRLTITPTMTVRVDFNRPAGASALPSSGEGDRYFDPALATSLLNFDQARAWRVAPVASGRAAGSLFAKPGEGPRGTAPFDESQPEVRVKIDSTGLFALPFDALAAKGYPANVPVAEVSVHRHEFLESADPPYETLEIPIEVEDANANGTFDSGDRVWVYVRNWAARSGASQYQRFWGDAEVVFVTRVPAGGLRMARRDGWRGGSLPALASFPLFEHHERNFAIIMPFVGGPSDTTIDLYHWTPYALYYVRPDTISVEANDIDTSRTVQVTVNWVGRKFSSHFEWAAVRNGLGQVTSVADSVAWSNKFPNTAGGVIRGSALTEGATNFLRIWGKPNAGPPATGSNDLDIAALNWFETTYYRRFKAVHDYLPFNSGDATGLFQVHGTGFSADSIRLFDVTDPDHPERLLIDPSHVTPGGAFDFQDSVAGVQRRTYVAAVGVDAGDPAYGPRVPPAANFSSVTRRNLYANLAGDYLLVVPEAFLAAAQPLAALRSSQGLGVITAPVEAVYDEFNGGRHSAAAIQRFVKYAYEHWSARFLLLLGDGTIDPLDNFGKAGVDWIPVLPTPGPVSVGEGYEIIPSDNRYGCLTGNCDPNYGFGDVIPEVMIGRLPVNSLAQATTAVSKVVNYETLGPDPSWRRNVLLLSDDSFSGEATFSGGSSGPGYCYRPYEDHFVGLNHKIASIITRDAGLSQMNIDAFDLRYYLAGEPILPVTILGDTCRPDRDATRARCHAGVTPQLFSHLNGGTLWWNFQGHANEYVLTHEDLFVNGGDFASSDDKFQFTNDGKPTIFSAFSCHANMFARAEGGPGSPLGGCLGEDMITLPSGRGAVASWASVCYEVVPRDDSSHVNVELARSLFAEPPTDEFVPGDRGARVVLGEAIQSTYLRYLPTVATYQFERGLAITYTLLGDPAQRISIGRPQTIVRANDSLVIDNVAVRLHTPGDTLVLVADLVSNERIDSIGVFENSGAGDVAIPASSYSVAPAFPDTAGGGIFGGRRFRVTYGTHLKPLTYHYLLRTRDRDGLMTDFTVAFALSSSLRVSGSPISDGDDVSPNADLSMLVVSPAPLNPLTDLDLRVNSIAQPFTATPAPGDASGREWVLSWTHPDFLLGNYVVDLTVAGGTTLSHRFKVTTAVGDLKLAELFAFPNPFDNDGTAFSFQLLGSDPADVKITVLTISGHPLYSNVVRGLPPGYHQLPWNGRDAEGNDIANGVYFYRFSAVTPGGRHVEQIGRLVKLRKPRHVDIASAP